MLVNMQACLSRYFENARTVRCLPMLLVLHLRFAGSHIDRVWLLRFLCDLTPAFKEKDAKGK